MTSRYQWGSAVRSRVILDRRLSAGARLLYAYLYQEAWEEQRFSISQEVMAQALGASPRTIGRFIAELRDLAYISVDLQRGPAIYEWGEGPSV